MESWLNGRVGWRWLLAAGFTIGGFYYIGFPQVWFYSMLLLGFTAAVAVICGRIAARQLIWPLAASLLGLALLLPALVVQLELARSMAEKITDAKKTTDQNSDVTATIRGMAEKQANYGKGIEPGLLATLAPFPFTRAEGFMELPANREQVLETRVVLRRDLPHGLRVSAAWERCWPIAVGGPGWGNIRGRPPPSSRSGWVWAGKACCGRCWGVCPLFVQSIIIPTGSCPLWFSFP